jgi:hypothetical protein
VLPRDAEALSVTRRDVPDASLARYEVTLPERAALALIAVGADGRAYRLFPRGSGPLPTFEKGRQFLLGPSGTDWGSVLSPGGQEIVFTSLPGGGCGAVSPVSGELGPRCSATVISTPSTDVALEPSASGRPAIYVLAWSDPPSTAQLDEVLARSVGAADAPDGTLRAVLAGLRARRATVRWGRFP